VEQRRLYLIYSTFYFAYFAALGIFAPYFPLYLKSLGFSGPGIAILLALGPVSRFLFPALWGLWADRAGHRKLLVVLTSCGACGAFSLLYWAQSFGAVALVLFLYGFLLAPSIPLVEGMVQEESDRQRFAYGPVRLWGSLGFIASTLFYGRLLDRQPVATILTGILIFSTLAILPACALPSSRDRAPLTRRSLRSELMRSETLRFLAATTLMQASHGAYYAYFSLHLDRHGYSRSAIGAYWTLAVAAEIGMMLLSSRLLEATGPTRLISVSLAVAALRWLLLMAGVDPYLLAFGQILHAFSFGLFHVCAVHATHRLFPEALRSSGQSLYSSLTYGLGNLVGFFGCAALVDVLGVRGLFGLSSALALSALLISLSLPRVLSRGEA